VKKTVNLGFKVTPETAESGRDIVARTSCETFSRFFRACLDDLIRKADSGEKLAEPIQLLTEAQRRKLESKAD